MIDLIIGFVIAGVLFVVEYFLCVKLKNPLWGGIIPMLILIGTIWIFASGKVPLTIRKPLSLMLSSRVSSCRRCVSFVSGFSKRNWSTDIS